MQLKVTKESKALTIGTLGIGSKSSPTITLVLDMHNAMGVQTALQSKDSLETNNGCECCKSTLPRWLREHIFVHISAMTMEYDTNMAIAERMR